ncbi:hypothetical protein F4810DRAFT_661025 [Camillea tinctor]|nr:hypothetical protein F4810DRAFT_661025 [Camillea tinctor]
MTGGLQYRSCRFFSFLCFFPLFSLFLFSYSFVPLFFFFLFCVPRISTVLHSMAYARSDTQSKEEKQRNQYRIASYLACSLIFFFFWFQPSLPRAKRSPKKKNPKPGQSASLSVLSFFPLPKPN